MRRELVHVPRGLSDEQWARTGQHELRGPVTIEAVARSIIEHEAEHRAQIDACAGAWGEGVRAAVTFRLKPSK